MTHLSFLESIERGAIKAFAATPPAVLEALARRRPRNSSGDRLAPEIALALAALNRIPGSDFSDLPVEQARRQIDAEAAVFGEDFPPFAEEETLLIPGPGGPIPATRYRAKAGTPRGLLVYFHGGGWVVGSRASTLSAVRFLATHAEVDVLSVDYRLAPEHPFPACLDDAHAAWDFALEQASRWGVDPRRIAVAGDSAGGNIAAVLSLDLRGSDRSPCRRCSSCRSPTSPASRRPMPSSPRGISSPRSRWTGTPPGTSPTRRRPPTRECPRY